MQKARGILSLIVGIAELFVGDVNNGPIIVQSASASRQLQIKNVGISLIKTKPEDGGTVLYFKIDNYTGSEIDVATFECNIFDSSSNFSEIVYPAVQRLSNGDSAYDEERIDLRETQFGRAECRGIDAFADDSSIAVGPPKKLGAHPRIEQDCSSLPPENRTLDCAPQ